MILGVVLAGGKSTRFGSDKAMAELGGRSLLSCAVENLSGWCDHVVIAGRETVPETIGTPCIPDWPQADMGPLAGIAAGLRHASGEGYDSVLTCGVDSMDLPENLPEILSPAPSYLASQPVVGHWQAGAAEAIEAILTGSGRHSMLAFASAIGAVGVKSTAKPANINTPADLAALELRNGI